METHSAFTIADPRSWMLHVSHIRARRLVVFVHGFRGRATSTWNKFPQSGQVGKWWQESDMLFVGYESMRENISSVADRLNTRLPHFYPTPFAPAMTVEGIPARDDISSPYEELILVGHSLGGLIIRIALADAAQQWVNSQGTIRPPLLSGQTRLFSPASGGFQPAGLLRLFMAGAMWEVIEMYLRTSSAYTELQPESPTIVDTKKRTESLFEKTGFSALQASILWANPDNVVRAAWYATDRFRDSADGQSHSTVCKPKAEYLRPWQFVEVGQ